MLGKFALLLSISKHGSLESLGIFGIFVSSVMFLNYLQGIEFHTYSAREIISQPLQMRATVIWNQIIVHLVTYLFILPMALLVFWGGFLSWEFLWLFYLIVIVTHIGQEIQRILIFISKPVESYAVAFFVHGFWAYLAVANIFLLQQSVNLAIIFKFWVVSASFGIILGLVLLRGQQFFDTSRFILQQKIITDGLRVSYKFFLCVIGFKMIEVSDRYFIQHFYGDTMVGVYTLFSGVTNVAQELVYTGVVVLIFPTMVKNFNEGDFSGYSDQESKMKTGVIVSSFLAATLVLLSMYILLGYLEKPIFMANFNTFIVLLVSVTILNLSLLPHYILYSHSKDSEIMWSVLAATALNIILNFIFIPALGILGAAISTLTSIVTLAIFKYRYTLKLRKY